MSASVVTLSSTGTYSKYWLSRVWPCLLTSSTNFNMTSRIRVGGAYRLFSTHAHQEAVMADSVVCHRVKECCVRLHSCVQKWQQLNSQGLDIANKLVQIVIQSK